MEIGCLGRWYDAGPILTANLGDTANPSWNDLRWTSAWLNQKDRGKVCLSTLVFGVDGLQYFRRNTFIGKEANSQVQIFTEKSKTEFYSLPEFTWQLFPEDWRGYKNDTYSYSELFSCSKDIVNPPRLVVYPAQAIPEK